MAKCKWCDETIIWDNRGGRNVPLNARGTGVHYCRRTSDQISGATPKSKVIVDAVDEPPEYEWTYHSSYGPTPEQAEELKERIDDLRQALEELVGDGPSTGKRGKGASDYQQGYEQGHEDGHRDAMAPMARIEQEAYKRGLKDGKAIGSAAVETARRNGYAAGYFEALKTNVTSSPTAFTDEEIVELVQLTHPDRHPPERTQQANTWTARLLNLRRKK